MVLNIIKKTIDEYNLFEKGDKVLIGLSGGADSVCLTHALFTLREDRQITLYAAHLNHGIRGSEAKRDEEFAGEFCKKLGIGFFSKTVDIPALSRERGESEESVGRNIRYAFFKEICDEYGINKIATAHNKNDNAETVLMNFMRGSSLGGLCGIPYKRENIVRPILNVSREEIENYCRKNSLRYVTDSTNLSNDYTRNKIRHLLIPAIEQNFNPNFVNTLTDNSALIREDSEYIDALAKEAYNKIADGNTADIQSVLSLDMPIRRRVARYMLNAVYDGLDGVSSVYIDDILRLISNRSGTRINLPRGVTARNEYGKLIIERGNPPEIKPYEYTVSCGETKIIKETGSMVTVSYVSERKKDGAVYLGLADKRSAVIRSRRSGDVFYPFGMNGRKKVKEFLIEKKIPKEKRNLVPVIEIDGIIAAVGSRIDSRFAFRDCGIKIEFKEIGR